MNQMSVLFAMMFSLVIGLIGVVISQSASDALTRALTMGGCGFLAAATLSFMVLNFLAGPGL